MRTITLIKYYGGKASMLNKILPLLDTKHFHYVEVFGGSGAILLNKNKSELETYNDIDGDLVNLFRIIRNRKKFEKFKELVQLTPYSREDYYHCLKNYNTAKNDIERAYMFYYVARTSFSGVFGQGISMNITHRSNLHSYLSSVKYLDFIHARLKEVQIENSNWEFILERFDTKETLFYLDPPYLHSARRDSKRYTYEMSRKDHLRLIKTILNLKGKIILSGYKSLLYSTLDYHNWNRTTYDRPCSATGTGRVQNNANKTAERRQEVIWTSPNLKPSNAGIIGRYLNNEEKQFAPSD